MANILTSKMQVPSLPNDVLILKDAEARQDLSTALATVTGNPLNFSTRSAQKANKTVISLEPIQDLHGYDYPWPAGSGVNKLPLTSDSTVTQNEITATLKGGIVTLRGTASADTFIFFNLDSTIALLPSDYKIAVFNSAANSSIGFITSDGSDLATHNFTWSTANRIISGWTQKDNESTTKIGVYVANGTNVNGLSFKPMVVLLSATDPTTFTPYSNICPIDGRTETSLVGCSKNMWGGERLADDIVAKVPQATKDTTSKTVTYSAAQVVGISLFDKFKANTQYTIYLSTSSNFTNMQIVYSDNTSEMIATNRCNVTPANKSVTQVKGLWSSGTTILKYEECGIFEGVLTAQDFEPYIPTNNLTIQFGEKVYGGTLDLETGELVVDTGYVLYNGSENWVFGNGFFAVAKPSDCKANTYNIISNMFPRGTGPNNCIYAGSVNMNVKHLQSADATEFKTFLLNNNLQVCYELITPRTIQLTPNEISLLSGVNVISSNADGISLTYRDGKVATLGDLDSLNVTISNALEGKVDEVSGKGLSTNDYTDEEKEKVAEIDDKANDDGSYGDMAVGSLLMSNAVKSTDTTPFLFRPIPPLSTPYIREKLVGASMAWNQLASFANDQIPSNSDGITYATDDNKSVTLDGTANANVERTGWFNLSPPKGFAGKENHKVYFHSKKISGSVASGELSLNLFTSSTTANVGAEFVKSVPSSNQSLYLKCSSGTAFTNYKITFDCIDLTLAFGTAIADRIYSMEQAQAGSGIAWIKSYGFLTDDYYANDAGSIQSVCADRKEIVGFNQWDEEWEVGGINHQTGVNNDSVTNVLRSKNYIPLIENVAYFMHISAGTPHIHYYDVNKNFVGYEQLNSSDSALTIPSGARFMRFNTNGGYNNYNHDICINISDTVKNGTYEPYHKTTISLGHDELRGVMQLDANNNLVYYGDEKTNDGVIDRKFGIVDLGTQSWTYSNGVFSTTISGGKTESRESVQSSFVNTKYAVKPSGTSGAYSGEDKVLWQGISDSACYVRVRDSSYTDATVFGTAMSGVYLVYPLATPTTEQSTPFEYPQYLFDGGTEEFIDYGVEQETRDVAVPVGHVTEYMGASDGTEIKDKFYLPTLPSYDGEYNLKCRIQNGLLTGLMWELIPD